MGNNYRPVQPLNGRKLTAAGLEPKLVISHKVVKTEKSTLQNQEKKGQEDVERLDPKIWYFNMVPGWAVVLIALAVGLNVGVVVFFIARRKTTHVQIPTEDCIH